MPNVLKSGNPQGLSRAVVGLLYLGIIGSRLKMEAADFSETQVPFCQPTQHSMPEDRNLDSVAHNSLSCCQVGGL